MRRKVCLLLVYGLAFSLLGCERPGPPIGRAYITNYASNTVSVIDTREHMVLEHVPVGQMPRGVAVSPDGREVYVANQLSDTISVIRTSDNRVVATILVDKGPYGIAVSPDKQKVYVTHAGHFPEFLNYISIINAQTRKIIGKVEVGNQPMGVVVSLDGKRLYVVNMWGEESQPQHPSSLSVIDTETQQVVATVDLKQTMAVGVAVSPDGKEIFVTHQMPQGFVHVIRAHDLEVVATVPVGNGPFGVAVSPDGKRLYVANLGTALGDETVSVISLPEHEVIATVKVGRVPVGLSVTPDGKEVYVANRRSNTVSVIDTATSEVTATIGVGEEPWAFGNFVATVPAS